MSTNFAINPFIQQIQANTLEELVFHLLNEIGLGINSNGFVYDQDTNQELFYDGKQIKASIDPRFPALANDTYGLFDPVFDGKFMSKMLGYYLKKSEAQEIINPVSVTEQIQKVPFYAHLNPTRTRRTRVVVMCENQYEYDSEFYYQKGLKFSDMILRLGGNPIDLWRFDSVPEEQIMFTHTQPIQKSERGYLRNVNFGGTAEENIINAQKKYDGEKHWSGKGSIQYFDNIDYRDEDDDYE